MKTVLRTTCAILGTFAVISSVHADTSANIPASSPDLSDLSVKIGTKTYAGGEATTFLLSRVKRMAETRKTAEDKRKFLEQFSAKLSKLAGIYETRSGKAWDMAKVLRAVEIGLENESSLLSSGVSESGSSSSEDRTGANGKISAISEEEMDDMRSIAKTMPEKLYVHVLLNFRATIPKGGWKDSEDAVKQVGMSYSSFRQGYPRFVDFIIKRAVEDGLAGKVGTQYLAEAFKTLPKNERSGWEKSPETTPTYNGKSVYSPGTEIPNALQVPNPCKIRPLSDGDARWLFQHTEGNVLIGWCKEAGSIVKGNYMIGNYRIDMDNNGHVIWGLTELGVIWYTSNEHQWLQEALAMTFSNMEKFYVNVLYETVSSRPQNWWKNRETAINYMLQSHQTSYNKYPKDVLFIIKQAVDDGMAWRLWADYLPEAFKKLPKALTE